MSSSNQSKIKSRNTITISQLNYANIQKKVRREREEETKIHGIFGAIEGDDNNAIWVNNFSDELLGHEKKYDRREKRVLKDKLGMNPQNDEIHQSQAPLACFFVSTKVCPPCFFLPTLRNVIFHFCFATI